MSKTTSTPLTKSRESLISTTKHDTYATQFQHAPQFMTLFMFVFYFQPKRSFVHIRNVQILVSLQTKW